MKLTPEQIKVAKIDVQLHAEMNITTQTVEGLADAYQRVEALAENLDTMTVLDPNEHRRNMKVAASIRRALYGEGA